MINGVVTKNQPDATLKGYHTENRGVFPVTNNGSVLTTENGKPNNTKNVEESQHHTRRKGLSFVTENYADGALTNNGSTLPESYIKRTQMNTMEVMTAYENMKARSASSSKPANPVEEAKQRELENLV
ncbi:hypothetical protein VNI00_018926 [Paramarasmius palmivorus]|uniref:Uncharacterized protein n=1 Tax=Paramarasmius palmivorus TaxID=297713 RepID=A0AAW0AU86_9AGAR